MKKILQISTLLLITFFYGQEVSNYQYIYIPEKFQDQEVNKYGLNDLLKLKLKQKNFTIRTESKENWPAEASDNPCKVLTADLVNTSNMFKNKLKIDFKDCENKTIGTTDGNSSLKDFEPGMRDALELAAVKIPISAPQTITTKTEYSTIQKAEIYNNGSLTFNKIFLANGEFILVNQNNSVPFATFKPSTKQEVYRVQLDDGTATLGYLEDGKIIVELTNANGSFRKEVFSRK